MISLDTRALIREIPKVLPNTAREKAVFPEEFSTMVCVFSHCPSSCNFFNIPRAEIDLIFPKGKKV